MRILLTLPLLFAAASPSLAQEMTDPKESESRMTTQFRLLAGAEYTEGEINEGREYETTSASVGLAMTSGRFTASVLLPYISTSAPEEVIISQGGLLGTPLLGSGSSRTNEVRREGIGDLLINMSCLLPVPGIDVSVGGAIKIPTASRENGLGTGEVDYGVSGQLSKRIGTVIPFVAGGYTIVGEPEGFEVRNTVSATGGSHLLLGRNSSVIAFYSYEQSASPQIGDSQKLGLGLMTKLSGTLRVGIEGTVGLSEDAPDAGIGLRIGFGL